MLSWSSVSLRRWRLVCERRVCLHAPQRLWFRVVMKLAETLFARGRLEECERSLELLLKSCQTPAGDDDMAKGAEARGRSPGLLAVLSQPPSRRSCLDAGCALHAHTCCPVCAVDSCSKSTPCTSRFPWLCRTLSSSRSYACDGCSHACFPTRACEHMCTNMHTFSCVCTHMCSRSTRKRTA